MHGARTSQSQTVLANFDQAKSRTERSSFGGLAPRPMKSPIITPGDGYNWMRACWRIQRLQLVDPYGWRAITPDQLAYIKTKLAEFEAKDWNPIFVTEKQHNHPTDVASFDCPQAREWMRRNMPTEDVLWTLRLSGKERIWGILRDGVFHLLFWDPNHQIKASEKKHT